MGVSFFTIWIYGKTQNYVFQRLGTGELQHRDKEMLFMYDEAVRYITDKIKMKPEIGIVLGSGLGDAFTVDDPVYVYYKEIPGFPVSTVAGHKGRFIFGYSCGKPIVVMQGRVHYYEGYSMQDVVKPIRLMGLLGIRWLILTNAAGGISEELAPGDIMIISDQISSFVPSPLIGRNIDEFGVRFPDMSHIYDKEKIQISRKVFEQIGLHVVEGTYIQATGPQYETPAEIRMFQLLGADAVGMSTACEAIAACHMGIRVSGFSAISNKAAGLGAELKHEDILDRSKEMSDKMSRLLTELIESYSDGTE